MTRITSGNLRRFIKYSILAIIILFLGRFIYSIIELSPYEYRPITGHDNRYLWIFNDSIASKLENTYSVGNEKDALYIYGYKNTYKFLVWELKSSKNINIQDISITRNNWFTKLNPPVTFFSYYFPPNVDVKFKTTLSFLTTLGINLGDGSEILGELKTDSFHSIYGLFTKFSFSNDLDEQITLDYGNLPVKLNLIFYKARNSFFIIIINPSKRGIVDQETLKLIKLK